MSLNYKNNEFEEFIKSELENHEIPFDNNDWLKLEKELPKKYSFLKNTIKGGIAAAVIVGGVMLFNNTNNERPDNKIITETKQVEKKEKIIDKKETVKEDIISESSNNSVNKKKNKKKNDNSESDFDYKWKQTKQASDSLKSLTPPDGYSVTVTDSHNESLSMVKNTELESTFVLVGKNEGCIPFKVKFMPLMEADSIIYNWNFGDGNTSTEASPNHIYEEVGSYDVSLIITYPKTGLSDTTEFIKFITTHDKPVANFEAIIDKSHFIFENQSIDAKDYIWNFGDGSSSNKENPKHQYSNNNSYTVKLTAISIFGCKNYFTKEVVMDFPLMPNAFTPDGDGYNDLFGPSQDLSEYKYQMLIYNPNGKLVFETNDTDKKWDGKIEGTNENAESEAYIYSIKITDKNGNTITKTKTITLVR